MPSKRPVIKVLRDLNNEIEEGENGQTALTISELGFDAGDREGFRRRRRNVDGLSSCLLDYDDNPYDIDSKHADEFEFEPKVAEQLYRYLKEVEKEKLKGDGQPLAPALERESFAEERMKWINIFFRLSSVYKSRLSTSSVHLAIHYMDRFMESYKQKQVSMTLIAVAALHLAAKYEEVNPISLPEIRSDFKQKDRSRIQVKDVEKMEVAFYETLDDFAGPVTPDFAHRYLQAVDLEMNVAAVQMARYLCGLAVSNFELTGHYYSKLAAASVFITYNNYINTKGEDKIEYPDCFAHHCGYKLEDLKPIVLKLAEYAGEVEKSHHKWRKPDPSLPHQIFEHYRQVGVTTKSFLKYKELIEEALKENQENDRPEEESKTEEPASGSSSSTSE